MNQFPELVLRLPGDGKLVIRIIPGDEQDTLMIQFIDSHSEQGVNTSAEWLADVIDKAIRENPEAFAEAWRTARKCRAGEEK